MHDLGPEPACKCPLREWIEAPVRGNVERLEATAGTLMQLVTGLLRVAGWSLPSPTTLPPWTNRPYGG